MTTPPMPVLSRTGPNTYNADGVDALIDYAKKGWAEAERLEACLESAKDWQRSLEAERDEARAEVERMREIRDGFAKVKVRE